MKHISIVQALLCAVSVVALAGCAGTVAAPKVAAVIDDSPPPPPSPGPSPASTPTPFSLVRYVGGSTSNWSNQDHANAALNVNFGYADLYTRFVLVDTAADLGTSRAVPGSPQVFRSYRNERQPWFARLGSDEERSVVAVARINLMNPTLALTVPLYSVSYNSGGDNGEAWATAMTSSYVSSPLFRITGNSRFDLTVSTTVSNSVQSSGFSTAISALTNAVSLISPASGILTPLSADANRNRAAALDTALSSLLSYSTSEEISFGRMVSSWRPDAAISLSGCAPFVRSENDRPRGSTGNSRSPQPNSVCGTSPDLDGGYNRFIGTWSLVLTCPQFSLFSSRSICTGGENMENISDSAKRTGIFREIAAAVSNSLVLEESLGENVTIRSLIRGADFFIDFVANDSPTAVDYGRFCASMMDLVRRNGLTGLDAALSLRASLNLMPEFVLDAQDEDKMVNCTQLLLTQGVALRS